MSTTTNDFSFETPTNDYQPNTEVREKAVIRICDAFINGSTFIPKTTLAGKQATRFIKRNVDTGHNFFSITAEKSSIVIDPIQITRAEVNAAVKLLKEKNWNFYCRWDENTKRYQYQCSKLHSRDNWTKITLINAEPDGKEAMTDEFDEGQQI